MMVNRGAVKAGLFWQSTSVFVQAGTQLIVLGLLARILEPSAFGLLAMANVAIAFGLLLSEAGVTAALVQRDKQLDGDFVTTSLTISLGLGILLFATQLLLSSWIERMFGVQGLAPVLRALAVIFVIVSIARVYEAVLQRELRFETLMRINITAQVCGYAFPAVLLATAGFGVWALVWGTLLQVTVRTCLLVAAKKIAFAQRVSWLTFREVAAFGFGLTKLRFWNLVMSKGDRLIIGRRLDVQALGHYQIVTQLAQMPVSYLGDILDAVFFPVLSRLQKREKDSTEIYLALATYSFVLTFGFGLFLATNGEAVITLICGEQWLSVLNLFQIICLGAGFRMITRVGDIVNRALGQIYQAAMRKMIMAVVFVPAVWIASSFGLATVCIVVVSTYVFGAYLISSLAWQGLGLSLRKASGALLMAALGIGCVLLVNVASLLLKGYLSLSVWEVLIYSSCAHVGVGAAFFWPVLRLWREVNIHAPSSEVRLSPGESSDDP